MPQGFSSSELQVAAADGRNIRLLLPFSYTRSDGIVIEIPAGTLSDGASTPPEVWPILPPFGKYWRAAVVHDYLYRYSNYPKDFCDDTLREAMLWSGVDEMEAITIYEAVKRFGQDSFDQDRQAQRQTILSLNESVQPPAQ